MVLGVRSQPGQHANTFYIFIFIRYEGRCTYLVVRGQLHGRDTVDVLLDLVEEVVPAADQATLVLVVDQVQLVCVPHLADLDGDIRSNVKRDSLWSALTLVPCSDHYTYTYSPNVCMFRQPNGVGSPGKKSHNCLEEMEMPFSSLIYMLLLLWRLANNVRVHYRH